MGKNRTAENPEPAGKKAMAVDEAVYTVDEFAAAAGAVFGTGMSPDIVRAAFRQSSLKEATVTAARKLVNEFAKKEVK